MSLLQSPVKNRITFKFCSQVTNQVYIDLYTHSTFQIDWIIQRSRNVLQHASENNTKIVRHRIK